MLHVALFDQPLDLLLIFYTGLLHSASSHQVLYILKASCDLFVLTGSDDTVEYYEEFPLKLVHQFEGKEELTSLNTEHLLFLLAYNYTHQNSLLGRLSGVAWREQAFLQLGDPFLY
jgi:hypothetical protein